MAINRPKGLPGLRGLRGLGELSEGERKKFYADNAAVLSKYGNNPMHYGIAAERLYNNQKFINAFGEDAFDRLNDGTKASYDYRNQMFHDKIVYNAFQEKFGRIDTPENRKKHPFTSKVASQLDIQGMYDLLTNKEYMGPIERSRQYQANLNAAKKVGKSYDAAINNPYVDAIGAGFMQWGKTESALRPSINDADYAKKDKEILDKLYAETQQRREVDIQDAADIMYASMLDNDDSGRKSLAQYYKEFDKFATKNSSFYNTFKNSRWLRDYTNEDRLKDYAKFLALKQKYGDWVALKYFERSMQNKIAEAQDGSWTGNTLKGVLTTTWSDLGSNVALLANVGKSAEQMAILNQGKDPNKPIYDKKGNIIDYQRNDNWVTNPAYWNAVYKYNTFSPTEIKAIEERGGISEDVNVREFGYTPDFFSWDTVEEGFKQGGHVIAGIIETGLTGAAGRAVGWAGNGAMKMMGLSAKAMQSASKAGRIANNFIVGATTGLEGSQLEAMGTFDEQLQTNKEKIQKQITKELYDYQRTINYNSNAAKLGINNIYRQLKAQDNKRVAMGNREGSKAFPLSDETLKAQAKQLYTNQLLSEKQKELQELHKKDELQAARDAEKAYATNFIMDYVKNISLTLGIQKFKIAKGSIRSAFDDTVMKNVVADAETGGVKRGIEKTVAKDGKVEKVIKDSKYASGKRLGLEIAKQLGGGFMDEYMDGLNASFAGGVGNNEFDNYIKRNYDPKAYSSTVDTFLGSMLAGMSEGIDGITDRQNLYEGFIGMISPMATATANVNAVFRPKDTWKAIAKGTDEFGNKMSKVDRLSTILMNPLLNTITEAKEKDRNIDRAVDAINAVIAANKDKLQDAAKVISVLGNYNGTLNDNKVLLDSKDNKLLNAFNLISTLNTLENLDGGKGSNLYKETMETMEGLAKGTLEKEQLDHEIGMFLADDDNKSILEEVDNSLSEEEKEKKKREIVAKRLKNNAKYFMDMKHRLSDIYDTFAHSTSMKDVNPTVKDFLAYNIIASDDYKKRLETLEKELNVGNTDAETLYKPDYNIRYYTNASRNKAVLAREREIENTQKEIDKIKEDYNKTQKKIASLKAEREATTDDDRKVTMKSLIEKKETNLKALEFQRKSVEERKRMLEREKEEISKLTDSPVIDESTILNADARDRAFILDPKNRGNYSEDVQAVIDNVSNSLMQKDPEALTKLQDAATLAQRVADMKAVYNKVLSNDELAAEYFGTVSAARDRAAMADSLQDEINSYYDILGKAYLDREKFPKTFKKFILSRSPDFIRAYMEDHPNQVDAIQPYYDMLKFSEDAAAVLLESNYNDKVIEGMVSTLTDFSMQANNREELEKMVEELIDSKDIDADTKDRYENMLSRMTKMGYQRDATILEKRAERKKREEEEKKKQEEAQKKAEEEAKAAAEKKTKEDKTNAETPDKDTTKENKTIDIGEARSDDDYKDVKAKDVATIDLGSENSEPKETATKDSETNIESKVDSKTQEESPTTDATPSIEVRNQDEHIRINYNQVVNVAPDEYESIPETAKHEENATFEAHSAEKDGDNWYFIGNFAGDKNETKVKSKKNLDKGVTNEEQQVEVKAESAEGQGMPENKNIIMDGDEVKGKSPSIEQQAEQSQAEGKKVQVSDISEDADTTNSVVQQTNDTNAYSLGGNAMSRYEPKDLENDGKLVKKVGKDRGDHYNEHFPWMEEAGIKLQNIIDRELARIINMNPHAKVKFMAINPLGEATKDYRVQDDLFLVLDYDNSINRGITAIHDDINGGVIESNGKKYLIIGVAGFPKYNKGKEKLYYTLWRHDKVADGLALKIWRKKQLDSNPNERFYVNEELSTEVVPYSQIPGYIVRQTEKDDSPKFRKVSELLADKERNPLGYDMQSVAWGIQEMNKFLLVGGATIDQVMVPRNPLTNSGSAFVLMPASNGKMVPSYLKPLYYVEMQDGTLKDRVQDLLNRIITPGTDRARFDNAIGAINELCSIFYLTPEGDDIHRSGKTVTLVSDGRPVVFTLDNSFDRMKFMQAFEEMNPRVNITADVLSSQELLKEYDEAGALTTDAALFGTAGSSYSIYALDKKGKMIMPANPINPPKPGTDSDYRKEQTQVVYDHQYYREDNGVFSLDGETITDSKTIEQLQYNKRIIDNQLAPVLTDKTWEYYILSSGEHPEAVKVDKNTKEVKVSTEEEAQKLIDRINEEKAKDDREKAAEKAIEVSEQDGRNAQMKSAEDVDILDGGVIVDDETGESIQDNTPKIEESTASVEESKGGSNKVTETSPREDLKNKSISAVKSEENQAPTQTFAELVKDIKYLFKVRKLVLNKFGESSKSISVIEKTLRDRDIEVDAIGTSEADIEAWIKTIEDCR